MANYKKAKSREHILMDYHQAYDPDIDPRRMQEYRDGGMIYEDHNAMANLPRMAQHREYPSRPTIYGLEGEDQ